MVRYAMKVAVNVFALVMVGSNAATTLCQRKALDAGIMAAASTDRAASPQLQLRKAAMKSSQRTFLNARKRSTIARAMEMKYFANFLISL